MIFKRLGLMVLALFSEVWTLTITPHSKASQMRITVPKIVVYLFLFASITYSAYVTFTMKVNFGEYIAAREATISLKAVKLENEKLRSELMRLAQETEILYEDVVVLQQQGRRIQSMIAEDVVDEAQYPHLDGRKTLLAYNVVDIEAGQRSITSDILLSQDSFCLIEGLQQDLQSIKDVLPRQHVGMETLEESVKEYTALMAATPSIWPLLDNGAGWISSSFGSRRDPFTGKQAFHSGIDIGIWTGTPVVATADGFVSFSGQKSGYGYVVDLDHGYGFQTTYAHNDRLVVHNGQRVKRGDIIAYSGNTGRSTAPHLHYEVKVNGVPHNPLKYISRE